MSSDVTAVRMTWAATVLGPYGFGLYASLLFYAGYHIYFQNQSAKYKRQFTYWVILSFPLSVAYMSTASKWSELEFIEAKESAAAVAQSLSFPWTMAKDVIIVLQILIAEMFNVYRLAISWQRCWQVMAPAVLIFAGATASGIILLVEVGSPGAQLSQHSLQVRGTAFWSISVGLDVFASLLIAYKLWAFRRQIAPSISPRGDLYSMAIAIFLESTALYAVTGVLYIVFFTVGSTFQYPLASLFNAASVLAPTLVFLRMGMGVATDFGAGDTDVSATAHLTTLPVSTVYDDTQYDESEYAHDEPCPNGADGAKSFSHANAFEMVDLRRVA